MDVHAAANVGDVVKPFAFDFAAACGTAFVGVVAVVLHERLDIADVDANGVTVDIGGGDHAHDGCNGDVNSDGVVVAALLFVCLAVVVVEQLASV